MWFILLYFLPSFVDTLSNFMLLCPWKVQQTPQLNNPGITEISIFSIHVYKLGGQAVIFVEDVNSGLEYILTKVFPRHCYLVSSQCIHFLPASFSVLHWEFSLYFNLLPLLHALVFLNTFFSFSHYFLPFVKPENTYIPFAHCKFATDACTSRSVVYILERICVSFCLCLWLEHMSANLANARKQTQNQERLSTHTHTHTPQGKHVHITSSGWVSVSLV